MAETKAEAPPPPGVAVVIVPLPAQGHLNQLLHLSLLLSSRGLAVHFVGGATHNRQVRDRALVDLADCRPIQFHDLPLPQFASPPPDPYDKIKFPGHLQPAFDAALHLRSPLSLLVRSLAACSRRVVIIHDSSMSFAAVSGSSLPNVEAFSFHSISAIAGFFFRWESRGKPPEPAIAEMDLPEVSTEGCTKEDFINFVRSQDQAKAADSGRLFNTCRAIESSFIDLVSREPGWKDKQNFAIGPLHPTTMNGGGSRNACMEWLNQQPQASVVYVSFGTTVALSVEQVAELAAGLEASGQRFLWVLRDADRADIYATVDEAQEEKLPLDFERRVEGRGKVVRGWAPQAEILAHPATGGFVSHCGWNSCIESFSAGVPILAWPMHSDQPWNAVLATHVLRVGFAVFEWAKRKELVPAAVIRDLIVKLMASEEGEAARRRARELGGEVRRAMADGGSSKASMDAFVDYITR
ncbi:hypothetical protein Cni_G07681 [Canna indica]|uniref:Glycosyltransferase n=1 Tax=Canna indica TaxID=4628 RepID=A0AAQ3K0S8_9LILI|nr:hypothetical protein Cni_G07681 [Canna indica]